MLGQPVSMLIPDVVGFKLTGKLREGITATDLVLTVTQMLRKHGVVGEIRRIFMVMGWIHYRWRIAPPLPICRQNMVPPVASSQSMLSPLDYMRLSGRSEDQVELVEKICQSAGHVA